MADMPGAGDCDGRDPARRQQPAQRLACANRVTRPVESRCYLLAWTFKQAASANSSPSIVSPRWPGTCGIACAARTAPGPDGGTRGEPAVRGDGGRAEPGGELRRARGEAVIGRGGMAQADD